MEPNSELNEGEIVMASRDYKASSEILRRITTALERPANQEHGFREDSDLDDTTESHLSRMPATAAGAGRASSVLTALAGALGVEHQSAINEAFLTELRYSFAPYSAEQLKSIGRDSIENAESGDRNVNIGVSQPTCARSRHQFTRVRPLHLCAAHSFVCFRANGDLIAVTPNCVLIYDRPPAACELSYKEPLYSIPVSEVCRVADLNDTSILMLRRGHFKALNERESDELLVAEVSTNCINILAKIALQQHVTERMTITDRRNLPDTSQNEPIEIAECRGMQVNLIEHKVYLLYDYHLAVFDLDMRLEPTVLRLKCRSKETGPAVALMEFDHAVYILTANSWLLASNKTYLFSMGPSSCCLSVLLRLDAQLESIEIRSYVVDSEHYTAFFSVPKGRKLVCLKFPVPASTDLDFELASAPLLDCLVLEERIYSAPNCRDAVNAVPSALAWDPTTEQLLVLEWGAENNGVLISVDIFNEQGSFERRHGFSVGPERITVHDRFKIVKSFFQVNGPNVSE